VFLLVVIDPAQLCWIFHFKNIPTEYKTLKFYSLYCKVGTKKGKVGTKKRRHLQKWIF